MDDAVLMREVHGSRQFFDSRRLRARQGAALHAPIEAAALAEFQREERESSCSPTSYVARMFDVAGGRWPGFDLKAPRALPDWRCRLARIILRATNRLALDLASLYTHAHAAVPQL